MNEPPATSQTLGSFGTDTLLPPLIRQAGERTLALLRQAAAYYGVPPPRAEIRFDLRGLAAGQVRFSASRHTLVRYNPLLLLENGELFLARTVPHEVAHVIAYRVHGRRIRPHGREWRAVMALLGADASRCHDFDTSRSGARRLRQFTYHCGCREHALTSIRHNRVRQGQVYLCRTCGQPLRPDERSG